MRKELKGIFENKFWDLWFRIHSFISLPTVFRSHTTLISRQDALMVQSMRASQFDASATSSKLGPVAPLLQKVSE